MANPVSAYNLYATGRGYGEAAKMIFLSSHYETKKVQVKLPLDLLIALSLELHLKAYLRHNGWTEPQLKNPTVRHNLEALYSAAENIGLTSVHPKLAELVTILAPHHKRHETRYMPDETSYPLLDMPLTFCVLDALEHRTGIDVGAVAIAAAFLSEISDSTE
jgi:hypothetical protein